MLNKDAKPIGSVTPGGGSTDGLFHDLESVFIALPGANVLLSPDLVVEAISNDYYTATQAQKECLLGNHFLEALANSPATREVNAINNLQASLEQVLATGQPHEMERVSFDAPDPHQPGAFITHYWQIRHTPVLGTNGQVRYLIHSVINVTPKLQVEEQLRDSLRREQEALRGAEQIRHRLESLFRQAPVAICILDGPDLVYEFINPTYQQLAMGFQQLGKPFMGNFAEKEKHPLYRRIREVYETGQSYEERGLLIPLLREPDGRLENHYFNYIVQARYSVQNQVDGLLIFAFDVTDQIKSRKAAEASAHQLRLVTDALPVLVGYLDKEEKYRFANQAYKDWFLQNPEELLGRPVREVVGEKAYQTVKDKIIRALQGERLTFEAKMPYRDDFVKHIRVDYVPDIQEGKVAGFYTMVTDITSQVEARKALQESEQQAKSLAQELALANEGLQKINRQLSRTNVDLDNFIYTASHDLKAPILNIEGLIGLLRRQLSKENSWSELIQEIVHLVLESVQRFKHTIHHLTDITKLQKESLLEASQINLVDLIKDVQLDLYPDIQATQAQIRVEVVPEATLQFSEKNLRSIIYNLLSNALKYHAPDRAPRVRIDFSETTEFKVLTVQDNGLGFNLAQEHKLFTMFMRLHDHVEGAGIGLYMVKKIIDNAGGTIEVQSKVGEGSTFKVYFPKKAIHNP
ncbi:PAS domain-containing sensor histidine kinase [Adhaeribacter arboris]|uniref:histidine kinase n=1 Tax=Adhaeribacter arboris TaxID=2072846 RepID=A0A2T2YDF0_9BACT|nr:PAS domain-containing protein [Adhaeribacter arboris]PSR53534.1 PAS domain-containing sensor histidine kinase [Adhaeribacter arboris]